MHEQTTSFSGIRVSVHNTLLKETKLERYYATKSDPQSNQNWYQKHIFYDKLQIQWQILEIPCDFTR